MSDALRKFIATRKREISQQMEELTRELKELDRAESAIGPSAPLGDLLANATISVAPLSEAPKADTFHAQTAHRRRFPGGIKGMVMSILVSKEAVNGMTAQQLIQAMKEKHGEDVQRTSLSPQLSRLKDDKWVSVEDGIWKATPDGAFEYLIVG